MTARAKRWLISTPLVLLLVAGVTLPVFNSVKISSATVAWQSPEALSRLEERVKTKHDSNAAYTIMIFYERNKHDTASYFLWLQRAADLGNENAHSRLQGFHDWAADTDKDGGASVDAEIAAWVEKGRKKEAEREKWHANDSASRYTTSPDL